MTPLAEMSFFETGIVFLLILLVVVMIIAACVKGYTIWQQRFEKPDRKDR
jgi:hypothetical protein